VGGTINEKLLTNQTTVIVYITITTTLVRAADHLERREKEGARECKVRRAGRRGYVWIRVADLPEVVIKAYELREQ
jgi:hypothetical protein